MLTLRTKIIFTLIFSTLVFSVAHSETLTVNDIENLKSIKVAATKFFTDQKTGQVQRVNAIVNMYCYRGLIGQVVRKSEAVNFTPLKDFFKRYRLLSPIERKNKYNRMRFIRSILRNSKGLCLSNLPNKTPTPNFIPSALPTKLATKTPSIAPSNTPSAQATFPPKTSTPTAIAINTTAPTNSPTKTVVAATPTILPTSTKLATPTPLPVQSGLEKYTGTFGRNEAFTLYERFAFGAAPEEIDQAVAAGLDATVNKLMTIQNESNLDLPESDIRCDMHLKGEDGDDQSKCAAGRYTELNLDGVLKAVVYRILSSPNPFYQKLFIFLHDERMAASNSDLNYLNMRAVIEHIDMLKKAAYTGNYYEFMKDYTTDQLGHLVWLDGESNIGSKPNENFAREFWELGTIGTVDLSGNPNYGILDIAQSAKAFSGWEIKYDKATDKNGQPYDIFSKSFVPGRHAPGEFTIFNGTPFATKVKNHLDVLNATFNHPRIAEHMAEDLWKEYVSNTLNRSAIIELAKIIRDSNYNIHPALKKLMLSKALYSPGNRKSLIKLPTDFYFGLYRTFRGTFNPYVSPYKDVEDSMYYQGLHLLRPRTVFGWDEKSLASQSVLSTLRNEVQDNFYYLMDRFVYNGKDFKSFLHANVTKPADLIDKLSRYLNVDLSSEQKKRIENFANNRISLCNKDNQDPVCKTGAEFSQYPAPYNPNGDNYLGYDVTLAILYVMLTMPEYYLK
jgi:uncharacterized protein (DUF1800 family)